MRSGEWGDSGAGGALNAFGHALRGEWALDSHVVYLNHGTVGATPRRVLAAQQALRDEMERQPARFLLREVSGLVGAARREPSRLRAAAGRVAQFVGARGEDLVFVDNATSGANAVLASLDLRAGDEILVTDHGYGAVVNAAAFHARRGGAVLRTVTVPYPRFDAARLLERIAAAIGPRTRLAIVDHITSESALLLPLREIAAVCRARGVAVLADGAHAPGAVPLDLPSLGVDWYAANLHKWAWAPRSCGLLWAAPSRQAGLHPTVISWGLDQGFTREFDWVGTRDPTPFLAAPAAIEFMESLGTAAVQCWNRELAWQAGCWLAGRWGTELGVDRAAVASMVTVALPPELGSTPAAAAALRDSLLCDDGIEVQLHASCGQLRLRISAQVYNELTDVERLDHAVGRRRRARPVARAMTERL